MGRPRKHQENEDRSPKEYLTSRISEGLGDLFRAAVPPGFAMGVAVEILIRAWLSLPQDQRMRFLVHPVGEIVADYEMARRAWEQLPEAQRARAREDFEAFLAECRKWMEFWESVPAAWRTRAAFAAECVAALRLWDSLPQDYRDRLMAAAVGPDLVELIQEVVDERIACGCTGCDADSAPRRRKPAPGGSRRRGSDNTQ